MILGTVVYLDCSEEVRLVNFMVLTKTSGLNKTVKYGVFELGGQFGNTPMTSISTTEGRQKVDIVIRVTIVQPEGLTSSPSDINNTKQSVNGFVAE